jgi:hypothetical protein
MKEDAVMVRFGVISLDNRRTGWLIGSVQYDNLLSGCELHGSNIG